MATAYSRDNHVPLSAIGLSAQDTFAIGHSVFQVSQYEVSFLICDLYIWLAFKFPSGVFDEYEDAIVIRSRLSDAIQASLHKITLKSISKRTQALQDKYNKKQQKRSAQNEAATTQFVAITHMNVRLPICFASLGYKYRSVSPSNFSIS